MQSLAAPSQKCTSPSPPGPRSKEASTAAPDPSHHVHEVALQKATAPAADCERATVGDNGEVPGQPAALTPAIECLSAPHGCER
eukprot:3187403-Pyramimonas_sp.AAC.1